MSTTEDTEFRASGREGAGADLVRLYLDDIARVPLLTAADEVALAKRIEGGDQEAKDHMVLANLRLVVHWARRYQDRGLSLLDLVQEGTFGLVRAVEKFDWRKGWKFSTYASWWIRKALQDALLHQGEAIRLPERAAERSRLVARLMIELSDELGRTPTEDELAAAADISRAQLAVVRDAARVVASLDQPAGEAETPLGDLLDNGGDGPDTAMLAAETVRVLRGAVDDLPTFERDVVRLRYGLDGGTPMSVRATAGELGSYDRRVREAETAALARLASRGDLDSLLAA